MKTLGKRNQEIAEGLLADIRILLPSVFQESGCFTKINNNEVIFTGAPERAVGHALDEDLIDLKIKFQCSLELLEATQRKKPEFQVLTVKLEVFESDVQTTITFRQSTVGGTPVVNGEAGLVNQVRHYVNGYIFNLLGGRLWKIIWEGCQCKLPGN